MLSHVSNADICILLVGNSYGSLSPDGISYTHREYRAAMDAGRPVFVFVDEATLVKFEMYRSRPDPSFWKKDEVALFAMIAEISAENSRLSFHDSPSLLDGIRHQIASHYGRLIREYGDLEALVRLDAHGWSTLSARYGARIEYAKAIYCARQALRLDPEHGPARGNLVTSLRRRGRTEEAMKECEEGLRRNPGSSRFHRLMVWCLLDAQRLSEANEAALKLVQGFPADERNWTALAAVHRREGAIEKAITAAEKAYAIADDSTTRRRLEDYRASARRQEKEMESVIADDGE